jgi:hypothetical protein
VSTRRNYYFTLVKHALGSFGVEDGYNSAHEDEIAWIRIFIVGSNLLCAYLFMFKIIFGGL